MILSVVFQGEWHYCESENQIPPIITKVMEGLEGEQKIADSHFPGDDAWFCFADKRKSHVDATPGCNLRVAINQHTGYGALIWFPDEGFPKKRDVYGSVWISNNPEPPEFDPRVVSDPGYPLFHDPASAIPIPSVRAAVEEFCRTGTGDRPECIDWVAGHVNGQRLMLMDSDSTGPP